MKINTQTIISRGSQIKIIQYIFKNMLKSKKTPPAFLRNTYDILQNNEYSHIICWTEDGKGFVIKDQVKFQSDILPKYFKHCKYTSFVRQLNMYEFHKHRNSNNENNFQHDKFKRGEFELTQIKRKPQKKKKVFEVELSSNFPYAQKKIENSISNSEESVQNEEQIVKQSKSYNQPQLSSQDDICLKMCNILIKQHKILSRKQDELRNKVLEYNSANIKSLNQSIKVIEKLSDNPNIMNQNLQAQDRCQQIINNIKNLNQIHQQNCSYMRELRSELSTMTQELANSNLLFAVPSLEQILKNPSSRQLKQIS